MRDVYRRLYDRLTLTAIQQNQRSVAIHGDPALFRAKVAIMKVANLGVTPERFRSAAIYGGFGIARPGPP
jgi:hypothetical protein